MTKRKTDPDPWQQANLAIESGNAAALSDLLQKNRDLALSHNIMGSLLHTAAHYGSLQMVKALVRAGADVNLYAEVGGLPICCAAAKNHGAVVTFLVSEGANLDTSTPDRNPLFSAVYGGHCEIVKLLIELGLNPGLVYRGLNGLLKNALSHSLDCGHLEVTNLLRGIGCKLPVEGVDQVTGESESKRLDLSHRSIPAMKKKRT